jgi:hypothetical protein
MAEADLTATAASLDVDAPRERAFAAGVVASVPSVAALVTVVFVAIDLWLSRQNHTTGAAQLVQFTTVGCAVMGALVASRRPRNPVGWILCAIAILAAFSTLVWDYGFHAVASARDSWPLGLQAFWLGDWIWLPVVCLGLPALTVRLPNGHHGGAWRAVDWLAILGTTALVLATALAPGTLDIRASAQNPFGLQGAEGWLLGLRWAGYAAVAAAAVGSVASLLWLMRRARGDEREQIKWIASAETLVAVTLAYGFVSQVVVDQTLVNALVPFFIATITLPTAIAISVLKYRLYEINLIINRALVYGTLTAGLAGLYALSVALAQILVGATGQRSNAAILITAFTGATLFTPAKERLQRIVNRRFAVLDPAGEMDSLRKNIDLVVNVLDADRIARRVVADVASSFEARFVVLSLASNSELVPFQHVGEPSGQAALKLPMRSRGQEIGVLSLGKRRGGLPYSHRDVEALQLCADAVADALAVVRATGLALETRLAVETAQP